MQIVQPLIVCHDIVFALVGLGFHSLALGFYLRYFGAASIVLGQNIGQLDLTGIQSALKLIDSVVHLLDIGRAQSLDILLHPLNLHIVLSHYSPALFKLLGHLSLLCLQISDLLLELKRPLRLC